VAKYCATAVWADERRAIFDGMRGSGLLSPGRLAEYFTSWWYAIKNISQFLFSHLSILQEVREIILRTRRLGMVYGRPGTRSKVHCMGRGFMADRIRGRSQSCRWIGLIGLCIFHTIEVPYLINVETIEVPQPSCAENYQSMITRS
jgi:hypothetical protein